MIERRLIIKVEATAFEMSKKKKLDDQREEINYYEVIKNRREM